ncbi:hypothetical protein GOSPT_115_00710 [Gordonia sputi NBRC 100414]|uniref:Uncharacterized protein n=1 Tax=Gordonia sputi NBRC 100414 TaxID=1089453 RepID=H5U506_9ACTN|nr:hypothetical protein A5766_06670 [Gordonia sp. 852002-51296_SCH5728562-b]GAB40814.1 hypothetical protein GOSPT_115_00710 [Gordonia sputi NBRC 100414]
MQDDLLFPAPNLRQTVDTADATTGSGADMITTRNGADPQRRRPTTTQTYGDADPTATPHNNHAAREHLGAWLRTA